MKEFEAAPASEFLRVTKQMHRSYKNLAENAINQLSDSELHLQMQPESNSVAILMKHVGGNLASRFSDFLISDGEKDSRNRDGEFEQEFLTREELFAIWEKGYNTLFDCLENLSESDLSCFIYIRKEIHSVPEALLRSLSHIAYHVGQIVAISKDIKGENWQNLSLPKKQS